MAGCCVYCETRFAIEPCSLRQSLHRSNAQWCKSLVSGLVAANKKQLNDKQPIQTTPTLHSTQTLVQVEVNWEDYPTQTFKFSQIKQAYFPYLHCLGLTQDLNLHHFGCTTYHSAGWANVDLHQADHREKIFTSASSNKILHFSIFVSKKIWLS